LDRERARENVAKWCAGKRSGRTVHELCRVAADEARCRPQITSESLLHRALHDVERAAQHVANLADGPALILGFRLERELRQRDVSRVGVANGSGE
jgi:hypothetical protein